MTKEFDEFVLNNRKEMFDLLEDFGRDLLRNIFSGPENDLLLRQIQPKRKLSTRQFFNIDLVGDAKLRNKIREKGYVGDEWIGKIDLNPIMREAIEENEEMIGEELKIT